MTLSVTARVVVWSRAGARCSLSECREPLIHPGQAGDPTLVGEVAHIRASSDLGPRAEPELAAIERDAVGNLILLCRKHHRIVDADPSTYTVELLLSMKASHESWVAANLMPEDADNAARLRYAEIVDEWVTRAGINDWDRWMSSVFQSGWPRMALGRWDALLGLHRWLLTRVWPGTLPRLEEAFEGFRYVLSDFLFEFTEGGERLEGLGAFGLSKFYKIEAWDPPLYKLLSEAYGYEVALLEDLALELMRAANLICVRVRESLDPEFRLAEGVLIVEEGPDMRLRMYAIRSEYGPELLGEGHPYPGIEEFLDARSTRDVSFGSGGRPPRHL